MINPIVQKHIATGAAESQPQKVPQEYDLECADPTLPAAGYATFADKLVRKGFVRKVFGTGHASPSLPRECSFASKAIVCG